MTHDALGLQISEHTEDGSLSKFEAVVYCVRKILAL